MLVGRERTYVLANFPIHESAKWEDLKEHRRTPDDLAVTRARRVDARGARITCRFKLAPSGGPCRDVPTIRRRCRSCRAVPTGYDMAHLVTYLRLLDADENGCRLEGSRGIVLEIDVRKDPERPKWWRGARFSTYPRDSGGVG